MSATIPPLKHYLRLYKQVHPADDFTTTAATWTTVCDIRDVRSGFRLIRMDETFALLNQVAFVGWMRADGQLVRSNATTYAPVKYLTMG